MKTLLTVLLGLSLALAVHGQNAPASQQTLDSLVGPIALYPDALVALILPASTTPADITLADRYLQAGGPADSIGLQPWNDSVKALAHYPAVIAWMDQNLAWTQALGDAFLTQPADVMNTVQSLRVLAVNSGALTSNAQQQVINQGGQILIGPAAQSTVVYVPTYDAATVYTVGSPITFGLSYTIGSSFIYDCNWSGGTVIIISNPATYWRNPYRYGHPGSRPIPPRGPVWRAPAGVRPRPVAPVHYAPPRPIRPAQSQPQTQPGVRFVSPSRPVIQQNRTNVYPDNNNARPQGSFSQPSAPYQQGQPTRPPAVDRPNRPVPTVPYNQRQRPNPLPNQQPAAPRLDDRTNKPVPNTQLRQPGVTPRPAPQQQVPAQNDPRKNYNN